MTLVSDSPQVLARFDEVCSLVTARKRGLTMLELGHAHALSRELEKTTPDPELVADLAAKLDLDLEELT